VGELSARGEAFRRKRMGKSAGREKFKNQDKKANGGIAEAVAKGKLPNTTIRKSTAGQQKGLR